MDVNKYWRVQTMTKDELAEWGLSQMKKYGIKQPETYTQEELKEVCPKVPSKKRNIKTLDEDDGYHD